MCTCNILLHFTQTHKARDHCPCSMYNANTVDDLVFLLDFAKYACEARGRKTDVNEITCRD